MKRFSNITTTQLARICKVSQGTVDRALNNRDGINPATKARILQVAKEYDYVPGLKNKGGVRGQSMLIGVVIFDLYNDYFSKIAMSFVKMAKKAGYSVIFLFSDKNIKNEKEAIDYLNYIGVDGIAVCSVGYGNEYANYLRSVSKPLVLIGNRIADIPRIGVDDYTATKKLAEKLMDECSEDEEIVYFSPVLRKPLDEDNAQIARLNGFLAAVEERKFNYRVVKTIDEIQETDRNIVCSTDHYVLRILNKLGIDKNRRLAGFDNINALRSMNVRVLTVDYSTDELALECIRYILGRRFHSTVDYKIVYNINDDE